MVSLSSATTAFLYLSATLLPLAAASAEPIPHGLLHKRVTYEGCYSSSAPLKFDNTFTYQSSGHCIPACTDAGAKVAATTNGGDCWCGAEYPSLASKVDLSKCDTPCQGFDTEFCGGDGFWTVYPALNGATVDNYGGSASSSAPASASSSSPASTQSPSSTTTAPPTVITSEVAGGQTVLVTVSAPSATSASPAESNSGGGGSNTAGIAAGVVVGVVAVAAIAAGLYFFIRHKKRKDAEEDFKQRTQVSDFMRGANERKPPGTGYSNMSDQRLDPEAGRRNSVGSLADNQDYSRRILRVANPDSS